MNNNYDKSPPSTCRLHGKDDDDYEQRAGIRRQSSDGWTNCDDYDRRAGVRRQRRDGCKVSIDILFIYSKLMIIYRYLMALSPPTTLIVRASDKRQRLARGLQMAEGQRGS